MLTGGEFRQVSNDGDQPIETQPGKRFVAGYFRTQAQNGVPVFWIIVGDALDGTREIVHRIKYTRQMFVLLLFVIKGDNLPLIR